MSRVVVLHTARSVFALICVILIISLFLSSTAIPPTAAAQGAPSATPAVVPSLVAWQVDNLDRVGLSNVFRHNSAILKVQFNHEGTRLASLEDRCVAANDPQLGADDHPVQVWDVATGARVFTAAGCNLNDIAFSPDGTWLAIAGRDGVVVYDLTTEQSADFAGADEFGYVAFSPDGRFLAGASGPNVAVWEVPGGNQTLTFPSANEQPITAIAFGPGGDQVFYAARGDVYYWDMAEGMVRPFRSGGAAAGGIIHSIAVSPDGALLATMDDFNLTLWDTATRRVKSEQRLFGDGKPHGQAALSFSSGSQLLASAYWGWEESDAPEIGIWDALTGELKTTLKGHTGEVMTTAFSGNGALLATGGQDGAVMLWSVGAGAPSGPSLSVSGEEDSGLLAASVPPMWKAAVGQPAQYDLSFMRECRINSTCQYYGGNTLFIKVCDVTATVSDVASGEVVAQASFEGEIESTDNEACPARHAFTRQTDTIVTYPAREEFDDWLLPVMSELGFE